MTLAPRRAAWLLWLAFAVGVTALVVAEHERRSVTPVYREAAEAWRARQPLYRPGIHGFLYLPAAALVYLPFTGLPGVWGGVVWRWAGLAVLATGVRRLAGLGERPSAARFLWLTALTLPALAGSARVGQSNVPMAGLMAHAAVDLAAGAWGRAALALALGLALKPTIAPLLLLVAAVYPRTAWRLAALAAAVLALPWLAGDPAYATAQYAAFVEKMRVAGAPPPGRWQDLTGLTRALGYDPPPRLVLGFRLAAAGATLALAWLARRRRPAAPAAVLILALGAAYILLWNPRTEGVTYLILTPAVAWLGVRALEGGRAGPGAAGAWLCVGAAAVYGVSHLLTPGKFNNWMRPGATLLVLGYLAALVLRPAAGAGRLDGRHPPR